MKKAKPKKPYIKIDWQQVKSMAAIDCTQKEIAAVLDVCEDTLERASLRENKKPWKEWYAENRCVGNVSLRRHQWKQAESGDKTMLIWLGKQRLGQNDRHEIGGKDGGPIEFKVEQDAARRLDDILDRLASKFGTGKVDSGKS